MMGTRTHKRGDRRRSRTVGRIKRGVGMVANPPGPIIGGVPKDYDSAWLSLLGPCAATFLTLGDYPDE